MKKKTTSIINTFTQEQMDNYNNACEIIDGFCIHILPESLLEEMKEVTARLISGEKLNFKAEILEWCDNNSWGYGKAKFSKYPKYAQKRYIENIEKSISLIYDDISLYW